MLRKPLNPDWQSAYHHALAAAGIECVFDVVPTAKERAEHASRAVGHARALGIKVPAMPRKDAHRAVWALWLAATVKIEAARTGRDADSGRTFDDLRKTGEDCMWNGRMALSDQDETVTGANCAKVVDASWPRTCTECGHTHPSASHAKVSSAGAFCTWCGDLAPALVAPSPRCERCGSSEVERSGQWTYCGCGYVAQN